MKNFLPHLLILTLGIGAIVFIWSGTTERLLKQSSPAPYVVADQSLTSDDGYVIDAAPDNSAQTQHQSPLVRLKDNLTRVEGSGFHLTVPIGWTLDGYDGVPIDGEYGTMSFGQKPEDAFLSDTAMIIDVMSFEQPKELRKEIMDRRMVSEDVRALIVETMHTEDPKSTLKLDDMLLFDEKQKPLGTFPVYRTGFQCLKTCYIEGPTPTRFSYFIDTGEMVYQFDVSMNTSKNTDALIKQSEAVIRSLVLTK